jgi:glyoxylase-like metal-dependent hydrolase (beta-lactamase superfamily II)
MRITDSVYVLSGTHFSAVNDSSFLGNVYGISCNDDMILVDCGYGPPVLECIAEQFSYYGIKPNISYVILTHGHRDHCGNAGPLQKSGARVIAAKGDVARYSTGGVAAMIEIHGIHHKFPAFTPDVVIDSDQEIKIHDIVFQFILVPGHTPGCMVIRAKIDGKILLFTGDIIVPEGPELINRVGLGWTGDWFYDKTQVVESILKLQQYDCDIVLPGHGNICLKNGTAVVRQAAVSALTTLR